MAEALSVLPRRFGVPIPAHRRLCVVEMARWREKMEESQRPWRDQADDRSEASRVTDAAGGRGST